MQRLSRPPRPSTATPAAIKGRKPPPRGSHAQAQAPARSPRAPKGDVEVKVDPKLKKLYDDLVAMIREASRKEALDFDRRWEAADRIVSHEPPLYVLGGYASPDAFYREVMEEEPRNARRYARVAR